MTVPQRTPDWSAPLPDALVSVSWAPDSRRAIVAGAGGPLWLVSDAGVSLRKFPGHDAGTFAAAWQPGGDLIASVGQDGHARLWNPDTGASPDALDTGVGWVEALAWSPSGDWLAVGAGKILHLRHRTRGWVHRLAGARSTLSSIVWRPDSRLVGTVSYGGIQLFDPESGEPRESLPWKTSMVSAAWSPDRKWVVAGTQENAIQVWPYPFKAGEELAMSGYPAKVRQLAWHHSGRYLATGGGAEIMVWDCGGDGPAGSTPRILEGHESRVSSLAYQHRGHTLASGDQDGTVLLWNAGKSSDPLRRYSLGSTVTALEFSPDDRLLLAACHDGTVAAVRV